jgi:hypothetical protein
MLGAATIASTALSGCFYEVGDPAVAAGAGASSGGGSQGATGGGEGGGPFVPACSRPGAPCNCPGGIDCVDGCCEIASPPSSCAEPIDVTAGGAFHATVCGGPVDPSLECAPGAMSPFLYLRAGKSPTGAGFDVESEDASSLRLGEPCGGGTCFGTSLPWHVEDDTLFGIQVTVSDPCAFQFPFEVIPL